MASSALVSVQEYLAAVYEPDREYIDGEMLDRNLGEVDHGGLQGLIVAWLSVRRKLFGIHIFPETRIKVARNRFRVPDIAVTTSKAKGRTLQDPPFLCLEIPSPEDRASRVEEKIDDYPKFGVAYVWLIEPQKVGMALHRRGH